MEKDGYLDFEWDNNKAASNELKHGATFNEAATVFSDPYARVIDDPDLSGNEERFVIIGLSMRANILTVCHCHRYQGHTIRIISARKATKTESRTYWRYSYER